MTHNKERDAGVEWGTPEWIIEPLEAAQSGFDLDPAAGAEPRPYAETRYTIEDDGLNTPWFGDVWLNPPYGRTENPEWAKRVVNQLDNCTSITALVPAATSTDWWQDYYAEHAHTFCFLDERVDFHGGDQSATFANVICVFGNMPGDYFEAFENMGTTLVR